jgi:TonB family protein
LKPEIGYEDRPSSKEFMQAIQGHFGSTLPNPDRRAHPRRSALSLAYVDLGKNNGGILLNISAGGLAIAAAAALHDDRLPLMRFQLPQSNVHIEATGQIVWRGESKKEAGVRFVNLSDEAATLLNDWLMSESLESEHAVQKEPVHTNPRRPFSSLAAAEPAPSTQEPLTICPSPEIHVEDFVPGSSFDAALRNSRVSITAPPVLGMVLMDEPNHARPVQILTGGMDPEAPHSRWWGPVVLVSLFAVVAFVAGVAAGGNGWGGLLNLFGKKTALANEHPQVADGPDQSAQESAPASEDKGAVNSGSDNSSAKPEEPVAASRNAAAIKSADAVTTALPGEPVMQRDSSGMRMQFPEAPVSASSSVAITSRRSIHIAPGSAALAEQQRQNTQIGPLSYHVEPVYPPEAERQGIEGTVEVRATVGQDGRIRTAQAVRGPQQLTWAALNAVRKWRYKPSIMDGQPIESEVEVKMTFRLPRR